ncbi:MAG: GNAT family N-acetyltransferase [Chitinophagaceae bacterium]
MITMREATMADAAALTTLMHDLGYQATEADVQGRLSTLLHHADYRTLVATTGNNEVVGMIGLIKNYHYEHNGCYIRIGALVVKKEQRKLGIGRLLMEEAERWARQSGANALLLNSGNREERTAAHAFYKSLGYEIKSSGFVKWLPK